MPACSSCFFKRSARLRNRWHAKVSSSTESKAKQRERSRLQKDYSNREQNSGGNQGHRGYTLVRVLAGTSTGRNCTSCCMLPPKKDRARKVIGMRPIVVHRGHGAGSACCPCNHCFESPNMVNGRRRYLHRACQASSHVDTSCREAEPGVAPQLWVAPILVSFSCGCRMMISVTPGCSVVTSWSPPRCCGLAGTCWPWCPAAAAGPAGRWSSWAAHCQPGRTQLPLSPQGCCLQQPLTFS